MFFGLEVTNCILTPAPAFQLALCAQSSFPSHPRTIRGKGLGPRLAQARYNSLASHPLGYAVGHGVLEGQVSSQHGFERHSLIRLAGVRAKKLHDFCVTRYIRSLVPGLLPPSPLHMLASDNYASVYLRPEEEGLVHFIT